MVGPFDPELAFGGQSPVFDVAIDLGDGRHDKLPPFTICLYA